MSGLTDFINDATREEQQQLDVALLRGEQLLWAVRPIPTAWTPQTIIHCASAPMVLAFMAVWTYGALGSPESLDDIMATDGCQLLFAAFSLPFWLVALWMFCQPLLQKHKMRRTVYAVTNRRALVLARKLFSWNTRSFTLVDNMIEERTVKSGKRGDLILGRDVHQGRHGQTSTKVGFLNVPDVSLAEEKLEEAVRALLAETTNEQD